MPKGMVKVSVVEEKQATVGTRTQNLCFTKALLCRLSYSGILITKGPHYTRRYILGQAN